MTRGAPRWKEVKWRNRTALGCTRCSYITTSHDEMVKHARKLHTLKSDPPQPHPLAGVAFETENAAKLASAEGLKREHFVGIDPSGARAGGFTVADVRLAARNLNRSTKGAR